MWRALIFQILQLDEQIDQQQRALASNQRILSIYQVVRSNGLAPDSEVARQQAEIHRLSTDLLELHRSRDVTENALASLIGVPAGEFKAAPAMFQEPYTFRLFPASCRWICWLADPTWSRPNFACWKPTT